MKNALLKKHGADLTAELEQQDQNAYLASLDGELTAWRSNGKEQGFDEISEQLDKLSNGDEAQQALEKIVRYLLVYIRNLDDSDSHTDTAIKTAAEAIKHIHVLFEQNTLGNTKDLPFDTRIGNEDTLKAYRDVLKAIAAKKLPGEKTLKKEDPENPGKQIVDKQGRDSTLRPVLDERIAEINNRIEMLGVEKKRGAVRSKFWEWGKKIGLVGLVGLGGYVAGEYDMQTKAPEGVHAPADPTKKPAGAPELTESTATEAAAPESTTESVTEKAAKEFKATLGADNTVSFTLPSGFDKPGVNVILYSLDVTSNEFRQIKTLEADGTFKFDPAKHGSTPKFRLVIIDGDTSHTVEDVFTTE